MFREAVHRFGQNVVPLAIIGLIGTLLPALPLMFMFGVEGFRFIFTSATDFHSLTTPFDMAVERLLVSILVMWLFMPFVTGAQLSAAHRAVTGEAVEVQRVLADGVHHYGRLLLYLCLMIATWVGLMLVMMIPWLGLLVMLALAVCVSPALVFFGPYVLVSEGLGAWQAYLRAWAMVKNRFGEVALSGLVMIGLSLLVSLINMALSIVPGVGWILGMAAMILTGPFMVVYMAVRYRTRIQPPSM